MVVPGTDPGPDGLRRLLLRPAREVDVRHVAQGDGLHGWVIVNVGGIPKRIALESGGVDLLLGREIPANLELVPYDVFLITSRPGR